MTVVNPKSISGITSITTASGSDNLLTIHTSDANNTERLRIDSTGTTKIVTGIVTTLTATTGIVTTLTANTVTSLGDVDIADTIVHTGDTNTKIRFPDVDTITAETGGSERLRITSSGTVGVNCTPTAAPLEVKQQSADGGALRLRDSSAQYRYLEFDVTNDLTQITARSNNSHGNINIGTLDQYGRTTQLYIKGGNTPKVGIGTDDPDCILRVAKASAGTISADGNAVLALENSNHCVLNMMSPADKSAYIMMGDPDDLNAGQIRYDNNTNNLSIDVNGGEKLRILSTGGITFNGDTATANALDDYEEGDWTPTFESGSGSITVNAYSVQYGKYVKIGKMVYVEGLLRANVTNNSNGTYDIGGLPFTVTNTPNSTGIIHAKEQSSWTVAPHHFSCMNNTTKARARGGIDVGDSAYTNANSSGFNSGSTNNNRVYLAGWYRVEGG